MDERLGLALGLGVRYSPLVRLSDVSVTLRQPRLVLVWVTVYRELLTATKFDSAVYPPWDGKMSTIGYPGIRRASRLELHFRC